MKKILSIFLCFVISFSSSPLAADENTADTLITQTADYIYTTAANPQVGSVGGEWAVLGLARSDADIPKAYFENYYKSVEKYVEECKGVLHDKKYTEYSRVILALTAIGKNPENIAGYNLLTFLGDYDKIIQQGINGSIWALIALDSRGYEIPPSSDIKVPATRNMYISHILENQTPDGGWALSGNTADADITAMALQALSKYQDNEAVKAATERALNCMSQMQKPNGGFSSRGTENSESSAQMIVALCELGIPLNDSRFVKSSNTILDNLTAYYDEGKGFKHTPDADTSNQMATEQCFYSLVALKRFMQNKNSLYNMSDVTLVPDTVNETAGLSGKHPDVRKLSILSPGKTFEDISKNKSAIEELAARNIITGKTENIFDPDATITRAEFAAIIVRGLGLPEKNNAVFSDVTSDDWFESHVNTAYSYGIINGVSKTHFKPDTTITREEAAVMIARAAKLCGMNTDIAVFASRDILAGFSDYVKASDWAISSLAFCYSEKILSDDVMEIKPKEAVTRAEIASMLYNTLNFAKLL